jgi:hypothetical protein
MVLRMTDQGITPEADSLRFTRDGRQETRPYDDIVEINLAMNPVHKSAPMAQMTIRFRNGLLMRVINTTAWGNVDADQTQHYYRFKADLHERLVASGAADRIRFTTGYTAGRAQGVKIAMFVAAAFFIGLPIILFIMTGQAQALLICLGGAAFVWPFYRASERNAPGRYDPRNPPDMLA